MLTFRTPLAPPDFPFDIHHRQRILCTGSCFAENIGEMLGRSKFQTDVNPFGILYNPLSIAEMLERLLENRRFAAGDLLEHEGLWHSLSHHGSFSKPDQTATLSGINRRMESAENFLKSADFLLVTFGSAVGFFYKKQNLLVGNCHKLPAAEFEKKTLELDTIAKTWSLLLDKLCVRQPGLKIIFTVSPVRYLREGFVQNQRSKARLILACEQLADKFEQVFYFPAYEIMTDDLRDYRFFEADMVHPNRLAIEYVWKIFGESFFTEETKKLNAEIEKIKAAAGHRPFHPMEAAHQQFLKKQLDNIADLKKRHPYLDFDTEEAHFLSGLKK